MQLLEQRDKKLIDVARLVRYESDAAFSKAFKRVVGANPGEYLKRGFEGQRSCRNGKRFLEAEDSDFGDRSSSLGWRCLAFGKGDTDPKRPKQTTNKSPLNADGDSDLSSLAGSRDPTHFIFREQASSLRAQRLHRSTREARHAGTTHATTP